ncbi:MAG: 6-bladed beta-propeller [Gemmatimonadaceae bacterium]|nr:6-bladed beta-propeller [Gemmatimonadaceae bacterium]
MLHLRRLKRPVHIVSLLLVLACAREKTAMKVPLAVPAIDTLAGGIVRVVNHGPTEWADTTGWKFVRELRFTPPDEGPGSLGQPSSIAVGAAGEIVVFDAKPAAIVVYSARGEFLRSIGRQGAGPGEYSALVTLRMHHDTLIVQDRFAHRLVFFALDGRVLGGAPALGGPIMQLTPEGILSFLNYLTSAPSLADDDIGEGVIRMRTDGTVVDTLPFPAAPRPQLWTLLDATHDLGCPIPFTPERVSRLDHDGRLLWGDQGVYRVIVAPHGLDTARIIEAIAPRWPIADSLRTDAFAVAVRKAPWIKSRGTLADIPTSYPLWTTFFTDEQRDLWVSRPGPNRRVQFMDVFDSAGVLRGTVPVPFDDAQVRAVYRRNGRFYLAMENDQGLTSIEVWRIQKQ